jgi:Mg-chelatase subunit ChlD
MENFRFWAFWRRLQYGGIYLSMVAVVVIGTYYGFFYEPANCFDRMQNGDEAGIDCDGSCIRICAASVVPPTVSWAKSFRVVDGQYNAVAYVENKNDIAGAPRIEYVFRLYDDAGLITERRNITSLPPDSTYPIFEGRIDTRDRVPTQTTLELLPPELWVPSDFDRAQFKTSSLELMGAGTRPRLNAKLENTALTEAQNIEIVATIFDSFGTPLTASQTFLPLLAPRSTTDLVFTWPQPIAKTLRSCEVPTDIVVAVDMSGSMNNDGGTPPEPISSVLTAAKTFIGQSRFADQIALVTFASTAGVVRTLTSDHGGVASTTAALTIDPKEERGFTNTGDAIIAAQAELQSSRKNENARQVIVLLTDGLATAPDPDPDAHARVAAESARAAGTILYTIGLGTSVNMEFLRNLASEPKFAFTAPTTDTLGTIYDTITASICEEGPSRIDVIPKGRTNFTPIQ